MSKPWCNLTLTVNFLLLNAGLVLHFFISCGIRLNEIQTNEFSPSQPLAKAPAPVQLEHLIIRHRSSSHMLILFQDETNHARQDSGKCNLPFSYGRHCCEYHLFSEEGARGCCAYVTGPYFSGHLFGDKRHFTHAKECIFRFGLNTNETE